MDRDHLPPVNVVNACLRDGRGGSPTAVLDDAPLSEEQRRRVPVTLGTSHAVFVTTGEDGRGRPTASLRFFTAEGELPACGHGTVAALALLAERSGAEEYRVSLSASGRAFDGRAVREGGDREGGARYRADFDPGPVQLRRPAAEETAPVLDALGVTPDLLGDGACTIASVGRPRLLVPLRTRSALAALAPDTDRLRAACDRLGLLGCYVHSVPTAEGRAAARMFAPSIGVPEDIANANSTACLMAHLATGQGADSVTVDMGDTLGAPATITASITAGAEPGPSGPLVRVGGTAVLTHVR
ncbi:MULTISPECIES: PhzF family phenazine biosynthesis protein [Streptacidiphilus]|uniref:PhzF family phenazine biosynthesis protein n=1 Tax=Streptacidiphilus cavernicola TaxID=3342716 RepID=A0ABV6UMJ9_9ACTN|nr:PhzF family phenazine biosynthesis isomerase [Streptacidiphilus jeojiense]